MSKMNMTRYIYLRQIMANFYICERQTKIFTHKICCVLTFVGLDIHVRVLLLLERLFYFRYKQKIKVTFSFMLLFTYIQIILFYSFVLIWFIPKYHSCESTEDTHHCVKPKIGAEGCEGPDMQSPTMALVPYNKNNDVLSIFNQPEREFNFAGQKLKISQDWNKLGVAAVVWDAVSVVYHYNTQGVNPNA